MNNIKLALEANKKIRNLSWRMKLATDAYFEDPTDIEKQQLYILTLVNEIEELQSIINKVKDLRDDFFP